MASTVGLRGGGGVDGPHGAVVVPDSGAAGAGDVGCVAPAVVCGSGEEVRLETIEIKMPSRHHPITMRTRLDVSDDVIGAARVLVAARVVLVWGSLVGTGAAGNSGPHAGRCIERVSCVSGCGRNATVWTG